MPAEQNIHVESPSLNPATQEKQPRHWHRPELSIARIRDASGTTTGIDDCGCGSLFLS